MVQLPTAASSIAISTIGVGEDYDSNLMAALARVSGGRHRHVWNGEGIPAAVAREVEGLLPLAAQNLELELVPAPGMELVDVEAPDARNAAVDAPAATEPIVTALGDLAPGDRRSVFAIVRVTPGARSELRPILTVRLRLQDPAGLGAVVTEERSLALDVAATPAESEESMDASLLAEVRLARLLDLTRRAIVSRDSRLSSVARQRIADDRPGLEELARGGETDALREQAALVLHLGDELAELEGREGLHGHEEEEARLAGAGQEALFRRYILLHHRRPDSPGHE